MKTAIDFIGMTMILLLGIIVLLGMGIVIAFECRLINRLRRPEPPRPRTTTWSTRPAGNDGS